MQQVGCPASSSTSPACRADKVLAAAPQPPFIHISRPGVQGCIELYLRASSATKMVAGILRPSSTPYSARALRMDRTVVCNACSALPSQHAMSGTRC